MGLDRREGTEWRERNGGRAGRMARRGNEEDTGTAIFTI